MNKIGAASQRKLANNEPDRADQGQVDPVDREQMLGFDGIRDSEIVFFWRGLLCSRNETSNHSLRSSVFCDLLGDRPLLPRAVVGGIVVLQHGRWVWNLPA